jgi:2-polyprenyl-6-hydroxyphenyl methylase/3-demethylubiquinone-9 3-methyltransferase
MSASTPSADVKVTFSFGKNWEAYLAKCFSEERVRISREWLLRFLELRDLKGMTFLDVGSGSGLSSLAAFDAGAERVLSFDIDPHSVATTTRARELRGSPANWDVLHGSVLDLPFLEGLGTWDIVYSWGVLHHTGRMWESIRNVASRVRPDGVFYTALYTTDPSSGHWTEVKKIYNAAGPFRKRMMEYGYVWRHLIRPNLFAPFRIRRTIREYKAGRGMDYMTDVRDWLGGYPFEHARIEQVLHFGQDDLGLRLVNLKTGEANTEYLFAAPGNRQWCKHRSGSTHAESGAINPGGT